MAGATIATWVKVRTKSGVTSRPISHKYEGGANYAPGQTITQSEYNAIKASRAEKEKSGTAIAGQKAPLEARYKSIMSVPKDIKDEVESAVFDALRSESSWNGTKSRYKEYSDAVKKGDVPASYESHYKRKAAVYDAIIKQDGFLNQRRQAIENGDFKTQLEAQIYVTKRARPFKEYDFFDSPEYKQQYGKLKDIFGEKDIPPPLHKRIPQSEIKKFIQPGDKLLIKEDAYNLNGTRADERRIVSGGTVAKVNVKNIKAKFEGSYMGRDFSNEKNVSISDVTHVIRDGKRYKVK